MFLAMTKWDLRRLPFEPSGFQLAFLSDRRTAAAGRDCREPIFAPDALLPPLRLHLLDRVLLI